METTTNFFHNRVADPNHRLETDRKTPVGSAFTLGCKVMVIEIPDDPHPPAVGMARWVLLAMGVLCFVLAIAVFFGRFDRPDLGLYPSCGIGYAAAFVRGLWAAGLVMALVLFFVER